MEVFDEKATSPPAISSSSHPHNHHLFKTFSSDISQEMWMLAFCIVWLILWTLPEWKKRSKGFTSKLQRAQTVAIIYGLLFSNAGAMLSWCIPLQLWQLYVPEFPYYITCHNSSVGNIVQVTGFLDEGENSIHSALESSCKHRKDWSTSALALALLP